MFNTEVTINDKQLTETVSDIRGSRDIKQGIGLGEITGKRQNTRIRKSLSENCQLELRTERLYKSDAVSSKNINSTESEQHMPRPEPIMSLAYLRNKKQAGVTGV